MESTPIEGLAEIKVIGVGGGGANAVTRMFRDRIRGVDHVAVNTDAQALMRSDVPRKIRIGDKLTRGLGVGGDPERGRMAAEESRPELVEALQGADMVFVAAGMGGGTGTGAAPVVADVARELEALTIGVVTRPFAFEGGKRTRCADDGVGVLGERVDTLITIHNERLLSLCDEKVSMETAFEMADDVLRQGVQAIAELVTVPGDINLDFADVKAVMSNAGPAWMAIGEQSGDGRSVQAAKKAVASPLLDVSIDGATRVLLNVTGGANLTLHEVQEAANIVRDVADPDAEVIFGMVTDHRMEENVRVTLVATGFPQQAAGEEDGEVEHLFRRSFGEDLEDLDLPPFLRRSRSSNSRSR